MKTPQYFFFFCLVSFSIFAGGKLKLIKQYDYAAKSIEHNEGFAKSAGGNDFSYHSLRMDVSDALLTRCTDGEMVIEWYTQNAEKENKDDGAWFTWLAAVQNTDEKHIFEVFVDEIKRFEFISGRDEYRKIVNPDGGILEFTAIESDQHNDSHGYMSLYAPGNWLQNGERLKIKIVGEAAGSNTWIIVYKADDVVAHLQDLVKFETWMNVSLAYNGKDTYLDFVGPPTYIGKKLDASIGVDKFIIEFNKRGKYANAELLLRDKDIRSLSFSLSDESENLINVKGFAKNIKKQKLLSKCLLINKVQTEDDTIKITCERIYKPHTVNNLLKLSRSMLAEGQINLMNSSHQDIAWMDSPEKCIIERDTMLLTPLYEKAMESDPTYRFDIEDALMLKEYIQRHPDRKAGITKLLNEGKISCGSNFIQPYEEMYSGESLVRQFYFGKKWLKDEFNYNAKVYWNVDVPGKVLQMPQILKKSGTDYMVISRFEEGIYNWYSPDGSFVTAYSPGHYGDAFMPLHKNVFDAANYVAESSLNWEKYYSGKSNKNVVPLLSDWDMSPAMDYSSVIDNWKSINKLKINKKSTSLTLPKFKITTAQEFLDNFTRSASHIPEIKGERPPVWLYIHGPSHYRALKASRAADILLTVAEKFSTINSLLENSFINYPHKRLSNAWESKIYPDHGWGGKMGDITDRLFLSKFKFAESEASHLTDKAIGSIASKIKTDSKKGIPIIVFNSLNWDRTDIAEFDLNFDEGKYNFLSLYDSEGEEVVIQLSEKDKYIDGTLKHVKINFIAENVPPTGYKTFYIKNSEQVADKEEFDPYQSAFYKISFANGGIKSIFDKELKTELLDNSKFLGGEIFTLRSEGNGAGEFADIQQPSMKGFDKTGNYETSWEILENGPVYSLHKIRQPIKNTVVETNIKLFKKLKRIDFDISLLNWEGVLYREYRMALPINMIDGQVSYETPFGVVNVGKDEIEGAAGERYTGVCKDMHPRAVENWISANNAEFGVTLSSCVAVADYIDPTDSRSGQTILQPILLASRKSCHSLGNEYLQTGNHHYVFSMTSHHPGWENGFTSGKEANEKLFVAVNPGQSLNAILPEEKSFFSVNQKDVIISTIKKAEDDNSVIVRLYNLSGADKKINLLLHNNIKNAYRTNLIEEGNEKLNSLSNSVLLELGKYSIETIKLVN